MSFRTVDLNADVGESFGVYALGQDDILLRYVSSANIACGFHAGDPGVMRRTVALARDRGVAIGAHPSLPDLVGFGRRTMDVSARELEDMVLYQIGALGAVAASEGVGLRHVKPHGALYAMTARDAGLAQALARAIASVDPRLVLIGPPRSALIDAGRRAGLATACEGFPDRAYTADGHLLSRSMSGAVIEDPAAVAARGVDMLTRAAVVAVDGSVVPLEVQTLCVHGDTPQAPAIARMLREAIEAAGGKVQAIRSAGET